VSAAAQLPLPFPADGPPARDAASWREHALARTRELVARARERWPKARLPEPTVAFDLRGLTAGEACSESGVIRYNEGLLWRYGQAFVDEIVPHEVAHLVAPALSRRRVRPHGAEWKAVMEFFGVPARRCHRFEAEPARRVRRVAYRCACPRPHLLTPRAHRRIRRGWAEYSCRECGHTLVRTEG
jgi:SprT protein